MMIEFSFLAFYPQISSVSSGFADLKETVYGLQLLSLLRLYGFSRYMKLIIHDDPELRDKRIHAFRGHAQVSGAVIDGGLFRID